jgi:hypothetical protein
VRFAEAFEMEKKANTPMVPLAAKAHFGAVIKKLAGTPGRQEDAHEFLSLLLDTVHEGIYNRPRGLGVDAFADPPSCGLRATSWRSQGADWR